MRAAAVADSFKPCTNNAVEERTVDSFVEPCEALREQHRRFYLGLSSGGKSTLFDGLPKQSHRMYELLLASAPHGVLADAVGCGTLIMNLLSRR